MSGGRTILTELASRGLLRAGRPLYGERNGATRVFTTQLGPGTLRGDSHQIVGRVGPGASLIVGATAATKIYGGTAESVLETSWTVEANGRLCMQAEPTILFEGARYRSTTRIELAAHARLSILEMVVIPPDLPAFALDFRTFVRRRGRTLVHDVLRLSPRNVSSAGCAIGTLVIDEDDAGAAEAKLERIAAALHDCGGSRAGFDRLASGAVHVRLVGGDAREVQELLHNAFGA